VSYFQTTTQGKDQIFREDFNRYLVLKPDDSPEQTKRVLRKLGEKAAGSDVLFEHNKADIINAHWAFQRELEPLSVNVPYGPKLTGQLDPEQVETRRYGTMILTTIKAIALLHQHQRERSGDELIATLEDYAIALPLLEKALTSVNPVSGEMAIYWDRLCEAFDVGESFTAAQADPVLLPEDGFGDVENKTARRWLNKLTDLGCLKMESQSGKTNRYERTKYEPGRLALPTVEELS